MQKPINLSRTVKASHMILTGYGHWLPNDPRGSGSTEIRKPDLRDLGDIHFGRKRQQPPRKELRDFYNDASPRLDHETLWFDETVRSAMAQAVAETVLREGYTCWALAILWNHMHAVIRTHRDKSEIMLEKLAIATHDALHARRLVPESHPVWSERPYKVYLITPDDVHGRIRYVEENPMKEGLPPQRWTCVTDCHL